MKLLQFWLVVLFTTIFVTPESYSQQQVEKKVILQGFWWDYHNDNYSNGWANYLADLAPRLKEMGIDAVWIPPSYKNSSPLSVGYSPFDHYDLGDKYQKGLHETTPGVQVLDVETRSGTKDELLRMIAILHANGIEVIQDLVLNHVDGAGAGDGSGGQDPEPNYSMVTNNGYKNFRYVCYASPVEEGDACDYAQRSGRWHKNYHNFYPNPSQNYTTGEWAVAYWGPDFAYGMGPNGDYSTGPSSNLCSLPCDDPCFEPGQTGDYNTTEARNWLGWMKKQTGVDGFRWDAVKHFPPALQQDLSYNCKYNLEEWARGETAMVNIGEYVGSQGGLDSYVDNVTYANGGNEMLMGTFDFGLRAFDDNGGIKGMVTGNGFFNMATIPGAQQYKRFSDFNSMRVHRTVPFVNNHDTFRPDLDASGNYQGWNSSDELSEHIDPYNGRLPLAYAVIMAVDGNPQIFMEDLFDLGMNGNRYVHDPKSTNSITGLPTRSPLVNLIWCHQNLDFKNGEYKVRSSASGGNVYFNAGSSDADLLVIERSGKAVIGLNDNGSVWQSCYVDTDFPAGTVLVDYSGANGATTYVVPADGRVNVNTPPSDPSQGMYGYSVWAPEGLGSVDYVPQRSTRTTQEWEMADDLGDSHCESLGQGGMLPNNSCAYRIAGKFYPDAGTDVNITIHKTISTADITVTVYNAQGDIVGRTSGTTDPLELSFNATSTAWHTLKVRNSDAAQPGQVVYARADYQAPTEISAVNDFAIPMAAMWNGNAGTCDWNDCANWDEGFVPTTSTLAIIPECVMISPCVPASQPLELVENRGEVDCPSLEKNIGDACDSNQDGTFDGLVDADCNCIGSCLTTGDIFVDINAAGTNDGSSWTNAFTDLQAALSIGTGQTIHIAEGTYLPTTNTSRGASFSIPNESILLGGYPTGGGARNTNEHITALSGEIDGVEGLDGNSYHVVKVQNVTCVRLDGLTIKEGNANNASTFARARGGGLYIIGSELEIFNVKVQGNKAIFGGGTFASLSPNVTITSSKYSGNTANNGSALYHSNETNMFIVNSRIIDNNSLIRSAIEVNNSLYTKIENSVIANNASTNSNAIALIATNRDQTFDVYNSTILGGTKNKYLVTLQVGFGDHLEANFYNTIVAHQNLNFFRAFKEYNNGVLDLNVENCYVQGADISIPGATAMGNLYSDQDGDLLLNADYSVNECSPVVDSGNDAFVTKPVDIDGDDRIVNAVDIGAYETQIACQPLARENSSVKVFPNPTSGLLNIQTSEEEVVISIYDMLGKRVVYTNDKEIDISNIAAGLYMLNIAGKDGKEIYIGKIVKE